MPLLLLQRLGVIGGLSLENSHHHVAHLSHAKFLCVRHLCVLCFMQCGEAEFSELSPPITPRLCISVIFPQMTH